MKSVKILTILIPLLLSFFLKGQTITPLPQFKNDIVIVKTFEGLGANTDGSVNVSDGSEIKYTTPFVTLKEKNQTESVSVLAQILNELKKQKYKLIGTNSAGFGTSAFIIVSNYVFQKE